jgi:hypothetical protein
MPNLVFGKFSRRLQVAPGVSVTTSSGSRVLVEARRLAMGSASDSYVRLLPYLVALRNSAPDLIIVRNFRCYLFCHVVFTDPLPPQSCLCNAQGGFVQMFFCHQAAAQGFRHCRRLPFLDSAHCRGVFKGMYYFAYFLAIWGD